MIQAARGSWLQAALLGLGLTMALSLRLAVAGEAGTRSVSAGAAFAFTLAALALAAGWRPAAVRPSALAAGALGAGGLLLGPAWAHLTSAGPVSALPMEELPLWALVVSAVAAGEELVLRGAMFAFLEGAAGTWCAVGVTALAFALLHVPLYGWYAIPLDLAVGLWLSGLRVLTGGVAAPVVAHVLADLATWWL